MQTKMRNTLKLLTVLLLVLGLFGSGLSRWDAGAASLPATPCTAVGTAVTCNLWAEAATISVPGVGSVPVWGYATSADGAPSLPGPVLIVNQGDTVTVNLTNNLGEATALLFNGQSLVPDTSGVPAGGSKLYTFTASQPGTFLYQASPLLSGGSAHQVAMGLYGALIVRPSGAASQAYASASTAFNDEALLVLSELDLKLNNSLNPAAFDLRTYHPTYFLINGKAYPATDPIDVSAGNTVLLRFVNAGLQAHSMSLLGLAQRAIAVDGRPFSHARRLTADTIFSGQTSDVLVKMPAAYDATTNPTGLKGVHQYAIFDAGFVMSSNSGSFGGMLAFLNMDTGIAVDDVGPATSGVSLSPDKVGGASPASVTLSATVSDALSGNSSVTAAEYFVGAPGADGTGTAMALGAGSGTPTVSVSAIINPTTWATGNYTIFVHGKDASNWGTFGTAVLAVDKAGPAIFSLELVPNPSDGSSVLLHVSADDRASGKSEVSSVTYTVKDGAPVTLTPYDSAASTFYFTAELTEGTAGTYSVSVFATDEWGNVGTFFADGVTPATIEMIVDQAGPTLNSLTVDTGNPLGTTNGVNQQLNSSIAAVRVTADFSDTTSTISRMEGFLKDCNDVTVTCETGTGFVFVSTDGLFDSQTETGYIDIPLAQFWILKQTFGPGSYTVSVHAQDASGNWSAFETTTVTVTP